MEIVLDGNPLLGGVLLSQMGCDTVVLYESLKGVLYICGHFKDFKPDDTKNPSFDSQITSVLTIVNNNKDKTTILMADANTQFIVEQSSLIVFSKDKKITKTQTYTMEEGVEISAVVFKHPTSNKIRGPHTAQLNKYLDMVTATIDHVLIFNPRGLEVTQTTAYVVNDSYRLSEITDSETMTTSPVSIPDHALVISSSRNGQKYGSLNIKGGDPEDKAWAEFIPKNLLFAYFNKPVFASRIDTLLLESFPGFTLKEIKTKDFLSTPRIGIFDINMPNSEALAVKITKADEIHIMSAGNQFIFQNTDDEYKVTSGSEAADWVNILLNDLNKQAKEKNTSERDNRRKFFIERGHMLLNFWNRIQNDTEVIDGTISFSEIYDSWHRNSTRKLPISEMVAQAKELHPELRVLSLQELPNDLALAMPIIKSIEEKVACKIYYQPSDKLEKCSTRGGIIVFEDKSSGGRKKNMKSKKGSRNKKRSYKKTRRYSK